MTSYFCAITFIIFFSLMMLFILIESNFSNQQASKKTNLNVTCIIIFVICIMEVLTILFDGAPLRFKFFHIASKFLGFSLTPLVFITLGNALLPVPQKHKSFNPLFLLWIFYVLWFLISLILGKGNSVFFVDEQNNYSRAKGFPVYMIFYGLGLVYFLIQNINLSIHYWQNSSKILFFEFYFYFYRNNCSNSSPRHSNHLDNSCDFNVCIFCLFGHALSAARQPDLS